MSIAGMNIGSIIAVYFVVWWISLFVTLPFGVRSQHEDGVVVNGSEPGAPIMPRLRRKVIANSILAAVLVALFLGLRAAGMTLDDVPLLNLIEPPGH